jgi:hypothetical protein
VIQFVVLIAGAFFVLSYAIGAVPGGIPEVLRIADEKAKLRLIDISLDPKQTFTLWVALFGAGSVFGLTRLSHVLKLVEPEIRGRLVVFFPGQLENNGYRLLDWRAGWNFLAVRITLHCAGASA